MINKNKVLDVYSRMSKIYDSKREKSAYFKIIEGITKRGIKENVGSLKGKKVLDAGCGTGRNISTFLELGANKVYGFDYTPEMLEFAKKRFDKNPKVKLAAGDVQDIKYSDNFFDVSGCFKVLAHIPDVQKAINELARVTKRGGLLFLEFYCPYNFVFGTNWFPSVILEAFYFNIPVISSDLKAIKEIVPNMKRGILIGNKAEFVKAVKLLENDKIKKSIIKNQKRFIKEKLDKNKILNEYLKAYDAK